MIIPGYCSCWNLENAETATPKSDRLANNFQWKRRKSKQLTDSEASTSSNPPSESSSAIGRALPWRRASDTAIYESRERSPQGPLRLRSEFSGLPELQPHLSPSFTSSYNRRSDPQGITVLHKPVSTPRTVDILFIHGLGGSSLCTWCAEWERGFSLLWPRYWLPEEPSLSGARILTFGYNANYAERKSQSFLTISDFASDLLYQMKFVDPDGDRQELGQVPMIIVAHSMGGIVFKKAFVLAHNNQEYGNFTSIIKAVLFLATPHRGTNLADTLNKILASSPFGHEAKGYIDELRRDSNTLNDLNDTFRHHASKLRMFSFYETAETPVGPRKMRILEKSSSLLGYDRETAQPLTANHNTVCKYESRDDSGYRSVLGALQSIIKEIDSNQEDSSKQSDLEALQAWLNVTGPPEDDMATLQQIWKAGTCNNTLNKAVFKEWLQGHGPHLLWAYAPPGSGKSVQCSVVVDNMKQKDLHCVYWFFKHDDARKRSVGNMLRSAAYQIAILDASFRRWLLSVRRSGTVISKAEASLVWKTIFELILPTMQSDFFWVIDGLDEAESSKTVVELLSNIGNFSISVRIFITSRPMSNISQSMEKAKRKIAITQMPLTDNLDDIRMVVTEEIDFLRAGNAFKQRIINGITKRSQGNFLWARLVLKKMVKCRREQDIERILNETPDGMDRLYQRMANTIAALDDSDDISLCKIFLSWSMYAKRPVNVEELKVPYPGLNTVFDLEGTIDQVCGQFVTLNAKHQVVLIHLTARDYLKTCKTLPFTLESAQVNESFLGLCLHALSDPRLRRNLRQSKISPFLSYASVSWAFHLDRASAESDEVTEALVKFFSGSFPLPWIQLLAMNSQLSELVAASTALTDFVRRRRKIDSIKEPPLRRVQDLLFLESWALDILKMTAKFGSHLSSNPDAAYKFIPPFCPKNSMLYQKFGETSTATVSVSGLTYLDWDDCLARVSHGTERALHIAVSLQHLAVANDSPKGRIQLWNNLLFSEESSFEPGEPILCLSFSKSGAFLACYCIEHTFVWEIESETLMAKIANPHRQKAKAMEFSQDESQIVIATDLRKVFRFESDNLELGWQAYDDTLLEETSIPEGAFINSPSSVAFNGDRSQLAVAYKGFPLAIWNLEPPEMIARCRRKEKQGHTTNVTWTSVNRVVWHPSDAYALGIYRDGNIFKWDPVEDTHEEVKQELDATPSEIRCGPTGIVFATSDVKGSVKIYDFASMVLIYKLSSDDIINDISFSPDSRRFYDLRGSYCNVWEPNCLTRLGGADLGSFSDEAESVTSSERDRLGSATDGEDVQSVSTSLNASEANANTQPAITAISTCADQQIFAFANEEGTVQMCSIAQNTAKEHRHILAKSTFGMGVQNTTLSRSGDFIAYSSLNGRVSVQKLRFTAATGDLARRVQFAEKKSGNRGVIEHLLFDRASKHLFVHGTDKCQVLQANTGTIIAENATEQDLGEVMRWDNHPTDYHLLLAFTARQVSAYSWAELELQYSIPLDGHIATLWVPSHHARLQLAICAASEQDSATNTVLLIDTSVMTQECEAKSTPLSFITSAAIPKPVLDRIDQPVSLLPDGNLVFLDENLFACTVRIRLTSPIGFHQNIKDHFFIPRDWLNSGGLALCRAQADGTFLCPSRGEVAIIKSDLN